MSSKGDEGPRENGSQCVRDALRDIDRIGGELERARAERDELRAKLAHCEYATRVLRVDLDAARAWSSRWKLAARDHRLRSRHWVSEYWRLLDAGV